MATYASFDKSYGSYEFPQQDKTDNTSHNDHKKATSIVTARGIWQQDLCLSTHYHIGMQKGEPESKTTIVLALMLF